jgi:putative transposase
VRLFHEESVAYDPHRDATSVVVLYQRHCAGEPHASAKAIQLMKSGSSKWMHEQQGTRFEWQVEYGAFTIGVSQIPATTDYILNQEKHHAKKSFLEKWKMFLKRHGLSEDEE